MNEEVLNSGNGMDNKPTAARTEAVIGAEIRNLTAAARYLTLYYAVEIGRRLTEAKELVSHGEWLSFLRRETEFSQPTASRFMKVFAEYGADQKSLFGAETKYSTLNNLSISNALRLLAVPEEEREEFALAVDAEHLSSRELAAAIRERDEARTAAETARAREQDTRLDLESARRRAEELSQQLGAANRELSEVNKALDESQQALEEERNRTGEEFEQRRAEVVAPYEQRVREITELLEKERDDARREHEELEELRARPIDVAVQEPDPDAVEKLAAELANKGIEAARAADAERIQTLEETLRGEEQRRAEAVAPYEQRAEEAESQLKQQKEKARAAREKLEAKLKEAEDKLAALEETLRSEGERRAEVVAPYEKETAEARAEVEALKKALAMSGEEITAFKVLFSAWQTAYTAMMDAMGKVPEEQRERCGAAVRAQAGKWCAE